MEVSALDSAPFWAMSPGGSELDLDDVTSLRWESLGQEAPAEGRRWTCWKVRQDEGRVLVGTVALAAEAPVADWVALDPEAFQISPLLYPLGENEAALWKELGRYVVAFQRSGQLLHFAMLSERTLGHGAAQELREVFSALEVNGFLQQLPLLRIWTEAEPSFAKLCETTLGLKARIEPKPKPRWPSASDILPPPVAAARREAAVRRRWQRIIAAVISLYVLFFSIWSGRLFLQQQQLEHRTQQLAKQQPALDKIQHARDRWYALESATDPDSYPAEVFYRLVNLLPPEGIQFQLFDMTQDKVVVSGVASSDHNALRFKSDLTLSEQLQQYTWNFPQPQTLPDSRASFRVEGDEKGSGGAAAP